MSEYNLKIYTKKGDEGQTSLYRGGKVSKDSRRVKAYGAVDELSSFMGLAITYDLSAQVADALLRVQNDLFIIGADLATPEASVKSGDRVSRLEQNAEMFLEEAIDLMEADLPELKNFILPGGTRAAATLHTARSVCRRAEREVVTIAQEEEVNPAVLRYLNRLSDYLFVAARWVNWKEGEGDVNVQP